MATQKAYRRACQAVFNDGQVYLCSSATSSNITLGNIADSSANASAHRFDGAYVYAINRTTGVGQQRRVIPGGFVASTAVLGIELVWSVTPTTPDEVEITHRFPCGEGPTAAGGVPPEDFSYNSGINRALSMIVTPDRVGLAIVQDAVFYSTTAWVDWLDREDRVVRREDGSLAIWEPGVTGGLPQNSSWRGWTLRLDGETPGLEVQAPFSASSGTVYLDVMRPSDTWIGTAGVWAEGTGLTNNLQEARAPINDVVKVFKMLALEALMARSPGRPDGNWRAMYPAAVRDAMSVRYIDRSMFSRQAQAVAAEEAAA